MANTIVGIDVRFTTVGAKDVQAASNALKRLNTDSAVAAKGLQNLTTIAQFGLAASFTRLATGAIADTVKAFAELDDEIRRSAIFSSEELNTREIEQNFKNIEQAVLDTAAASRQSTEDIAKFGTELARSGKTGEAFNSFLENAAIAADAAGESVGVVGRALLAAAEAFQVEDAEGISLLADQITAIANLGTQGITDINEALKITGSSSANAGQELQNVGVSLVALDKLGTRGTLAGTGLNVVLRDFAKQTSDFNIELRKAGIETTRLGTNGRQEFRDFDEVLIDVTRRFEEVSQAQGEVAGVAFLRSLNLEERGFRSLATQVNLGSAALIQIQNELRNVEGVTRRQAEFNRESLQAAFESFGKAGSEAARTIVGTFAPALEIVVRGLTAALNLFNALPGPVKGFIALLAGVGATATVTLLALTALQALLGLGLGKTLTDTRRKFDSVGASLDELKTKKITTAELFAVDTSGVAADIRNNIGAALVSVKETLGTGLTDLDIVPPEALNRVVQAFNGLNGIDLGQFNSLINAALDASDKSFGGFITTLDFVVEETKRAGIEAGLAAAPLASGVEEAITRIKAQDDEIIRAFEALGVAAGKGGLELADAIGRALEKSNQVLSEGEFVKLGDVIQGLPQGKLDEFLNTLQATAKEAKSIGINAAELAQEISSGIASGLDPKDFETLLTSIGTISANTGTKAKQNLVNIASFINTPEFLSLGPDFASRLDALVKASAAPTGAITEQFQDVQQAGANIATGIQGQGAEIAAAISPGAKAAGDLLNQLIGVDKAIKRTRAGGGSGSRFTSLTSLATALTKITDSISVLTPQAVSDFENASNVFANLKIDPSVGEAFTAIAKGTRALGDALTSVGGIPAVDFSNLKANLAGFTGLQKQAEALGVVATAIAKLPNINKGPLETLQFLSTLNLSQIKLPGVNEAEVSAFIDLVEAIDVLSGGFDKATLGKVQNLVATVTILDTLKSTGDIVLPQVEGLEQLVETFKAANAIDTAGVRALAAAVGALKDVGKADALQKLINSLSVAGTIPDLSGLAPQIAALGDATNKGFSRSAEILEVIAALKQADDLGSADVLSGWAKGIEDLKVALNGFGGAKGGAEDLQAALQVLNNIDLSGLPDIGLNEAALEAFEKETTDANVEAAVAPAKTFFAKISDRTIAAIDKIAKKPGAAAAADNLARSLVGNIVNKLVTELAGIPQGSGFDIVVGGAAEGVTKAVFKAVEQGLQKGKLDPAKIKAAFVNAFASSEIASTVGGALGEDLAQGLGLGGTFLEEEIEAAVKKLTGAFSGITLEATGADKAIASLGSEVEDSLKAAASGVEEGTAKVTNQFTILAESLNALGRVRPENLQQIAEPISVLAKALKELPTGRDVRLDSIITSLSELGTKDLSTISAQLQSLSASLAELKTTAVDKIKVNVDTVNAIPEEVKVQNTGVKTTFQGPIDITIDGSSVVARVTGKAKPKIVADEVTLQVAKNADVGAIKGVSSEVTIIPEIVKFKITTEELLAQAKAQVGELGNILLPAGTVTIQPEQVETTITAAELETLLRSKSPGPVTIPVGNVTVTGTPVSGITKKALKEALEATDVTSVDANITLPADQQPKLKAASVKIDVAGATATAINTEDLKVAAADVTITDVAVNATNVDVDAIKPKIDAKISELEVQKDVRLPKVVIDATKVDASAVAAKVKAEVDKATKTEPGAEVATEAGTATIVPNAAILDITEAEVEVVGLDDVKVEDVVLTTDLAKVRSAEFNSDIAKVEIESAIAIDAADLQITTTTIKTTSVDESELETKLNASVSKLEVAKTVTLPTVKVDATKVDSSALKAKIDKEVAAQTGGVAPATTAETATIIPNAAIVDVTEAEIDVVGLENIPVEDVSLTADKGIVRAAEFENGVALSEVESAIALNSADLQIQTVTVKTGSLDDSELETKLNASISQLEVAKTVTLSKVTVDAAKVDSSSLKAKIDKEVAAQTGGSAPATTAETATIVPNAVIVDLTASEIDFVGLDNLGIEDLDVISNKATVKATELKSGIPKTEIERTIAQDKAKLEITNVTIKTKDLDSSALVTKTAAELAKLEAAKTITLPTVKIDATKIDSSALKTKVDAAVAAQTRDDTPATTADTTTVVPNAVIIDLSGSEVEVIGIEEISIEDVEIKAAKAEIQAVEIDNQIPLTQIESSLAIPEAVADIAAVKVTTSQDVDVSQVRTKIDGAIDSLAVAKNIVLPSVTVTAASVDTSNVSTQTDVTPPPPTTVPNFTVTPEKAKVDLTNADIDIDGLDDLSVGDIDLTADVAKVRATELSNQIALSEIESAITVTSAEVNVVAVDIDTTATPDAAKLAAKVNTAISKLETARTIKLPTVTVTAQKVDASDVAVKTISAATITDSATVTPTTATVDVSDSAIGVAGLGDLNVEDVSITATSAVITPNPIGITIKLPENGIPVGPVTVSASQIRILEAPVVLEDEENLETNIEAVKVSAGTARVTIDTVSIDETTKAEIQTKAQAQVPTSLDLTVPVATVKIAKLKATGIKTGIATKAESEVPASLDLTIPVANVSIANISTDSIQGRIQTQVESGLSPITAAIPVVNVTIDSVSITDTTKGEIETKAQSQVPTELTLVVPQATVSIAKLISKGIKVDIATKAESEVPTSLDLVVPVANVSIASVSVGNIQSRVQAEVEAGLTAVAVAIPTVTVNPATITVASAPTTLQDSNLALSQPEATVVVDKLVVKATTKSFPAFKLDEKTITIDLLKVVAGTLDATDVLQKLETVATLEPIKVDVAIPAAEAVEDDATRLAKALDAVKARAKELGVSGGGLASSLTSLQKRFGNLTIDQQEDALKTFTSVLEKSNGNIKQAGATTRTYIDDLEGLGTSIGKLEVSVFGVDKALTALWKGLQGVGSVAVQQYGQFVQRLEAGQRSVDAATKAKTQSTTKAAAADLDAAKAAEVAAAAIDDNTQALQRNAAAQTKATNGANLTRSAVQSLSLGFSNLFNAIPGVGFILGDFLGDIFRDSASDADNLGEAVGSAGVTFGQLAKTVLRFIPAVIGIGATLAVVGSIIVGFGERAGEISEDVGGIGESLTELVNSTGEAFVAIFESLKAFGGGLAEVFNTLGGFVATAAIIDLFVLALQTASTVLVGIAENFGAFVIATGGATAALALLRSGIIANIAATVTAIATQGLFNAAVTAGTTAAFAAQSKVLLLGASYTALGPAVGTATANILGLNGALATGAVTAAGLGAAILTIAAPLAISSGAFALFNEGLVRQKEAAVEAANESVKLADSFSQVALAAKRSPTSTNLDLLRQEAEILIPKLAEARTELEKIRRSGLGDSPRAKALEQEVATFERLIDGAIELNKQRSNGVALEIDSFEVNKELVGLQEFQLQNRQQQLDLDAKVLEITQQVADNEQGRLEAAQELVDTRIEELEAIREIADEQVNIFDAAADKQRSAAEQLADEQDKLNETLAENEKERQEALRDLQNSSDEDRKNAQESFAELVRSQTEEEKALEGEIEEIKARAREEDFNAREALLAALEVQRETIISTAVEEAELIAERGELQKSINEAEAEADIASLDVARERYEIELALAQLKLDQAKVEAGELEPEAQAERLQQIADAETLLLTANETRDAFAAQRDALREALDAKNAQVAAEVAAGQAAAITAANEQLKANAISQIEAKSLSIAEAERLLATLTDATGQKLFSNQQIIEAIAVQYGLTQEEANRLRAAQEELNGAADQLPPKVQQAANEYEQAKTAAAGLTSQTQAATNAATQLGNALKGAKDQATALASVPPPQASTAPASASGAKGSSTGGTTQFSKKAGGSDSQAVANSTKGTPTSGAGGGQSFLRNQNTLTNQQSASDLLLAFSGLKRTSDGQIVPLTKTEFDAFEKVQAKKNQAGESLTEADIDKIIGGGSGGSGFKVTSKFSKDNADKKDKNDKDQAAKSSGGSNTSDLSEAAVRAFGKMQIELVRQTALLRTINQFSRVTAEGVAKTAFNTLQLTRLKSI